MTKYCYVYRITCLQPQIPYKYYYGIRSASCLRNLASYWSSSKLVKKQLRTMDLNFLRKKLLQSLIQKQ